MQLRNKAKLKLATQSINGKAFQHNLDSTHTQEVPYLNPFYVIQLSLKEV